MAAYKNTKTQKQQYSKSWMSKWQYFIMFWLSVFFIADIYYNHCEHLEALCITLVTSIIATIIPYFAKSYLETKEEERMKYTMLKYEDSKDDEGGLG